MSTDYDITPQGKLYSKGYAEGFKIGLKQGMEEVIKAMKYLRSGKTFKEIATHTKLNINQIEELNQLLKKVV